jgi:hypothetical protein
MLGLLIAVKYANCGEQLQADCCIVCSAEEATDWKYCNRHDRNRTHITRYSVHLDGKYVVWKYCKISAKSFMPKEGQISSRIGYKTVLTCCHLLELFKVRRETETCLL